MPDVALVLFDVGSVGDDEGVDDGEDGFDPLLSLSPIPRPTPNPIPSTMTIRIEERIIQKRALCFAKHDRDAELEVRKGCFSWRSSGALMDEEDMME